MIKILLLSALVVYVSQAIWVYHQNKRREAFQCLFMEYVNKFLELTQHENTEQTRAYMTECIRMEEACLAAQESIKRETFIWPWRWVTRWNADYFKEALDRA